ncbi:MAG TPA: hypothetical protein PLK04_10225 [Bacillota bacterium]|nr:hypothetical protein [Bacillota bacterium]HPZ14598.1 hypothetical protein [Bacillota bacterium]
MCKYLIAAALGLLLALPAYSADLEYQAAGGQSLVITAKNAEQQIWQVRTDGSIVVAAVIDGKLVLEDFQWQVLPNPPKPEPQPEPKPEPEPEPPVPDVPKTVIWIEESSMRTPSQAAAIIDKQIRQAIEKSGWRLRIVDQDIVDENGKPPAELAPYLDSAKGSGLPRLFILADGKELFAGAAPDDIAGFVSLLRKFGLRVEPGDAQPESFSNTPAEGAANDKGTVSQGAAVKPPCESGKCYTPTPTVRRWRVFR